MSLLFHRREFGPSAGQQIPRRGVSGTHLSADAAMRHSAVWACRRLRADLISTMPVDVYRRVQGVQVETPKPPLLTNPGGSRIGIAEWMYSTQMDLDGCGNTFGLITERDGAMFPKRIELQPVESVTVRVKNGAIWKYRIGQTEYDPADVWHEKQFTASGLHVGLSPLAYAALTISTGLSAQQFAVDWFKGGGVPKARLKNTAKTLTPTEAEAVKAKFRASVGDGDLFVHGSDWDYEMIASSASETQFLETMAATVTDVCRFLGVPGDMIDAESSSGAITYANVTQRNLQLLIMNLGPAVVRREWALSQALPAPRYVKLNSDALLRMDPKSRAELLKLQIDGRTRTPDEARELDNLPPLTEPDYAQFARLFQAKPPTPTQGAPA